MGTTHAVNPANPPVAYEGEVARDLVRRVLLVAPVVLLVAGVFRGLDGRRQRRDRPRARRARTSSLAARSSPGPRSARPARSWAWCSAAIIVRIGVLFGIALALENVSLIDLPVLVLTIAVVHLALLTWETRHVSLILGCARAQAGRADKPS